MDTTLLIWGWFIWIMNTFLARNIRYLIAIIVWLFGCWLTTSNKWILSFLVIYRWGSLFVCAECCLCHHLWSSCIISWINPPHFREQLCWAPVLVLWDLIMGAGYSLWGNCIFPKKESSSFSWWERLWWSKPWVGNVGSTSLGRHTRGGKAC